MSLDSKLGNLATHNGLYYGMKDSTVERNANICSLHFDFPSEATKYYTK